MTQPKGRPAIERKDRRVNFTISVSPWLKTWLDAQPVSRGEALEQAVRFWLDCQTATKREVKKNG